MQLPVLYQGNQETRFLKVTNLIRLINQYCEYRFFYTANITEPITELMT